MTGGEPLPPLDPGALNALALTGASAAVQAGLHRYCTEASPVGHFLTALLEDRLRETLARADQENILAVRALALWLYNYAPGPCHGSPSKVEAWLARGRAALPADTPLHGPGEGGVRKDPR